MLAPLKALISARSVGLLLAASIAGGGVGFWLGSQQSQALSDRLAMVATDYGTALAANARQHDALNQLQEQQRANAQRHSDELARLESAAQQAELYAANTINDLEQERAQWVQGLAQDESYQRWANTALPHSVIERVRDISQDNHHR